MDKEVKKRRRSVRNLRRTSGILPLNLDVLNEKPEESKQEFQPEENQQVFGSMWCESLEPVVKKRRRRSSLLVGLVPKQIDPDENNKSNEIHNQKAYLTKIGEDQTIENDTESIAKRNNLTDRRETLLDKEESSASGDTNKYNIYLTNLSDKKTSDNGIKTVPRTTDLMDCVDTFNENVFDKHKSPESYEQKDKWNEKFVKEIENRNIVKNLKGDEFDTPDKSCNDNRFENDKCEDEKSSERVFLNTSDLNNITPPSECNLSNVSPSSMSPEYPGLYQEPLEEANTAINANNDTICNAEMTSDAENEVVSILHSKSIQKLPSVDHMSDLSHSDKENSVVNENTSMNLTPHVQGDSIENVSPGFMSMCKAFAGKVVNFVKTSPSFLTGGLLDSSNTANVCASPELKAKTSLNVSACELSNFAAKSDINKSLDELEKSENDTDHKGFKDSDIGADCKGDNNSAADIYKKINTPTEKSLSTKKSENQCRFGSAKKPRDRKLFYDTYNAVMDVLKNDKGKSSSTNSTIDDKKVIIDEAGSSCSDITFIESTKASKEKIISSPADKISHDENFEDNLRVKSQNVEVIVTQHFNTADQKYPTEFDSTEPKVDFSKDTVAHNSVASKIGVDETVQNTNKVSRGSEDKNELNDIHVSENVIERKIEENESQDGLSNAVVGNDEISCDTLDQNMSRTDDLCMGNKTNIKGKDKRYKRRALDVPVSDDNVTVKSADIEKDIRFGKNEKMSEGKKILVNCETFIEKISENLAENAEELTSRVKDIDCLLKLDTPECIDSIHIHEESQLEIGKKTTKSLSKARRNRRQSFGIQSCVESVNENSNSVLNSVESDTNAARAPTSEADEVDGINDNYNVECHNDIENKVAALNLGNEEILDIKVNNDDECDIEIRDSDLNDYVEKKKRGQRRKSANLNEILKRGRPKKVLIEPVVDEAMEDPSLSQKDGNTVSNVCELADEISQVRIFDNDQKVIPTEIEITKDSLVLPGDDIRSGEGKVEPRRKRRRSAEAASLRLQMINSDQSPSSSETVTTNKGKRGRRKSADSTKFDILTDLNKENSFTVENSNSDIEETTVAKRGRKRKFKEESVDELEKLYKNKNFVKPEEKKPWHTVLESPPNLSEVFGKKRLQRHIDFQVPSQMKLRRRLQKAVKNGWDPKKRIKMELEDDFVKGKLVKLWSELDEEKNDSESLQNKLRSIIETD